MSNNDELTRIRAEIKRARAYAKTFWRTREFIAASLAAGGDTAQGAANIRLVVEGKYIAGYAVEFPDPDTCHVYTTMFGRKMLNPPVYRLSFVDGVAKKWRAQNPLYASVPIPGDWQEGDGIKMFGGE